MKNFLGIKKQYSDYSSSAYCILPIPYERSTTYGHGTKDGPQAVIEASHQVEFFDEEFAFEPFEAGIHTLQKVHFQEEMSIAECFGSIHKKCRQLVEDKKFVISIGGEHTISFPLVAAFCEKFDDLTVLQFDAHADLRQEYLDSPYNHACVMARIKELTKIAAVGIRALSRKEKECIQKDRLPIWFAHKMHKNPGWMDEVLVELTGSIYITFDVDFLDPAIMPATGTPEPGGFYWRETLEFLHRVFQEKNVVGCDVVELSPRQEFHAADFLVARLIYKMIAMNEAKKRRA